jgi:starch phosphorylase
VEIREAVGPENFFLFGLTADEVEATVARGYRPGEVAERDPELKAVLDLVGSGFFSPEDRRTFRPLVDALLNEDRYLILADFRAYAEAQSRVVQAYLDPEDWTRMAILNVARVGRFSSDRTIREYSRGIWGIEPVEVRL